MTLSKILAVAAVVTTMFGTSAMAQGYTQDTPQDTPHMMPHHMRHHASHHHVMHRASYNGPEDNMDTMGNGTFGYTEGATNWEGVGYNGGHLSKTYIERNQIVCMPGTVSRGADNLMHVCQ
jgi:hypothetical protein